jgi:hypothetical protein
MLLPNRVFDSNDKAPRRSVSQDPLLSYTPSPFAPLATGNWQLIRRNWQLISDTISL